jgi:hypothetical protein
MVNRLLLGLVIGVVLGAVGGIGLAAVGLSMAGALGYVWAAVMGVLVGLLAGKPIWAKGALIEAGLKATIGAALACGLLFAVRFIPIDVPALALGGVSLPLAKVGDHAIAALVSIATVLAVFYEIDNTAGPVKEERKRIATASRAPQPAASTGATEQDDSSAGPSAKKRR